MKAVVMAGGEGSRLRPLTVGRPKPLVPIVNKAVIGHILDLLKSHGITEVVITLRYMASSIQDFLDDGENYGVNLTYSVEETPLGTAGSVKNAAHLLGDDEPFIVISGDALTDFDLGEIIASHQEHNALATLTLAHVEDPLEYGVIVTDDEGWITQFLEKPTWGELISDTVNTGIYVLEPEVLAMIPEETNFDFSIDLFPALLAKQKPVHGYVADGYWCDVGDMEAYMRANADMLYGKVKLSEPLGEHIGGGIWVGKDVEIAPSAQLFGPIYLGNQVKIKGDVTIYGPAVIRDYSVIDNYSRIERSILWRNNYVGETCELRGTIISRQCSIKSQVVAFEGVVIGDNCIVGEGAALHANVKLWPRKEVEAGATVKESIIWGNQGRRSLFARFGVSGVVNIDLTPEFAAKLSAALGASLDKGSYVAINRDIHRASRMIKRALVSGLPGTGVNVWDLGTIAIPVARYFVRNNESISAGIHVRISPFDQRVIDIRFTDAQGMNQSSSAERAIERVFFREDFRRAYFNEIGTIDYAGDPIEIYTEEFMKHVDVERIRKRNFRLVVDYSYGLVPDSLSGILTQLNVDLVPLNARMDENKLAMLEDEFVNNRQRMAQIVGAVGADLGIQFDVGGEKIFIVDDKGRALNGEMGAALMMELALYAYPGRSIAVPVTMPNAFDAIARWHDAGLIRIRKNLRSLMSVAQHAGILLVIDGHGNFIFPDFQPAVDGMMASVRLLEFLAIRDLRMSEVVDYLPPAHIVKERVPCPWGSKGKVMRLLNENHSGSHVDKIDGLKIHLDNDEWVHILPNPDTPLFVITAEAGDTDRAAEVAAEYRREIESFIESEE